MIKKNELKELTITELKKIGVEKKIKFDSKIKKDELIKLILGNEELIESTKKVKKNLENNPTSNMEQVKDNKEQKSDFFQNVPDLPIGYGKNKLILMVRDPYWGFVYWEITDELINQHQLKNVDIFLRIYDITTHDSPENSDSYIDVKLDKGAANWYVKFPQSNKTYIIDYGYIKDGKFVTVLRSNKASTPRDDVSDQIDEEWMLNDEQFRLILKASGADQMFEQIGSQELMKFLAGNVEDSVSSSSGGSPSSPFGSLL